MTPTTQTSLPRKASASSKIKALGELQEILAAARTAGRRIVLCHGVFDLLHPGHILHLKEARKQGDLLIVSLTPDRFVRKGPGRPLFNQRLRLETIAALEDVDFIALNEWPTAVEAIRRLRPHVYVKGSDYADASDDLTDRIVDEQQAVEEVGGRIFFTDEETFSSSHLINRFFSAYPEGTQQYLQTLRAVFGRPGHQRAQDPGRSARVGRGGSDRRRVLLLYSHGQIAQGNDRLDALLQRGVARWRSRTISRDSARR